jgi:hypothetical protein
MTPFGAYLSKRFRVFARLVEFTAGLPHEESLTEAARMTSQLAFDLGYRWSSLREGLADHPEMVAEVPEGEGRVDSLPWGAPKFGIRDGRLQLLSGARA